MNQHFRVAVSCCPSEEEKVWRVEGESLQSPADGETYSFDHLLRESSGGEELYRIVVSPLVSSALEEGHELFVVCYGLPATGKTRTVFGSPGQLRRAAGGLLAELGRQIFDSLASDLVSRVSASFFHVFEDGRVTDLFDSRRRRLEVAEDRSNNSYSLPALSSHQVSSPLELARLTERANIMRNASGGSREQPRSLSSLYPYRAHCSHAFVSLTVERVCAGERERVCAGERERVCAGDRERVLKTQITVVDLAGHSIALIQSGHPAPDSGVQTLQQILTTLPSQGIVATSPLFPTSSLTKLLRPSLGGNSETLLLGTVSLSESSRDSSRRCLQVLEGAMKIKNYCRRSLAPLSESDLGRVLHEISDLKKDVCGRLGVSQEPELWWTGQEEGREYVDINGQRYSEISSSCGSLLQRLDKLEGQLLYRGVSNKKQNPLPVVNNAGGVSDRGPPPPLARPFLHKPAQLAKPMIPLPVATSTPQHSVSHSSSSSLDSSSSEDDVLSQPSTPHSGGPPPPPLRDIPHVIPNSTFVPPRPAPLRPSSASSAHQSLASSSQVSSDTHTPQVPLSSTQRPSSGSSHSSSLRTTLTPSHPHPSHTTRAPLPPRLPVPVKRLTPLPRTVLPLPLRAPRPLLPVSVVRPHPPTVRPHPPVVRPHPPVVRPHPLGEGAVISSRPKGMEHLYPPTYGLPLPALPPVPPSPPHPSTPGSLTPVPPSPPYPSTPGSLTPVPPSPPHPSTPGSLTPNAGSPALTPSPSPSPLPRHPPSHLPPLTTSHVTTPSPVAPLALIFGGNPSSSSSSLTLTDSDLSQEAQDTFDPIMRTRALSMQRNSLPYTGSYHPPQEEAPPYDGNQRENERESLNMSEYTSREEIHTAAMEGVKSSHLKRLAIQYGVDYRDHGGRTPLMYAVLGNQPRMCDTLLGLGAKVNTQDGTGLTPLLWATFQAKPQCMKILLRHGADVHIRDSEGRSVFHWAVKTPNIHCLKTLQRQATPTIINTADNEGLTPLHWAVLCNLPTHTHLLLTSTAADVNMEDTQGRTALTHAVLSSSSTCIKAILEVSEDSVKYCDEKGRTALHYACAEGSTECVRTIVSARSCDLHCRDKRGTTPLHWAAAANQPSVLQLLLRRGVDRSLKDNDEMIAVDHAEVRGHTECAHILRTYGLRRPSSALSVASQVSVHAPKPVALDRHGHISLSLPHRRFSLSQSSLLRPPADGQAHPDDSLSDHTQGAESQTHNQQQGCDSVRGEGVRRREWWREVICGCSRRRNAIMPAPDVT